MTQEQEKRWEQLKNSVMSFDQFKDEECKNGRHNWVRCDEWGENCSHCGKIRE